ncbi:polyphosphate:AMP phosphotransferase [Christensenella intestinihominis]|uniref:polyphosphate:AMP phosphotransferase n=1 Tax=Christensenella intestinihominis TaxID=1851429 RepID=UPI0008374E7A|nr:polyphosphate:AMP phosphotransferase [Christensenella intestinihominis]
MLKELDLKACLPKEEYEPLMEELKPRLVTLQQEIIREKIPVIIMFEGLSAAGKGEITNFLILNFDARGFTVYNTRPPEPSELRLPWLARFMEKIPSYGRMAIFDRAWYSALPIGAQSKKELKQRLREVNTFERQLADDGYLILKYFLYIGKKEQKKRLEALRKVKNTAWRVTGGDFKNLKRHGEITDFSETLIEKTDTPYAPWHVVAATDKRYVRGAVFSSIVEGLEKALARKREKVRGEAFAPKVNPHIRPLPHGTIGQLELNKSVKEAEYRERLAECQNRLFRLQNKLYLKKIPVIVAYEGNDAAGKGGNIKRVAAALDARGYAVTPIAAPSPDELNHQYLWRFWRALPRTGHFAIFDRTWYGRVLVERVEGLTPIARINQAYNEINEFEALLARWGAVIFKFWLAIDKDEQLRRFEDRQNTPEKQWKITEEDWRNRGKWDAYTQAVDDMFRYTNTDYAPWTAVESNCKYYARLKTLETMIETLKNRL